MNIKDSNLTRDSHIPGVLCSILYKLRLKSGITRGELARRTGLSSLHLARIEEEQDIEIRLSTLVAILDTLGYDLLFQPKPIRASKIRTQVRSKAKAKPKKTKPKIKKE